MVKLFTVIRSLYEFVATSANDLLIGEADGISVWGGGTDGVANVAVLDSGTPANDVSNGAIEDYLTNGTTSPKLCYQSDGTYKWSPHNYMEHSDDISAHQFANGITSRTTTTITLNSAAGQHRTADTVILGDDETVTLGAEFKPGTHDYVTLGLQGSSDHATVVADLSSTGSISETNTQGSATIVSSGVSDAGDGWFLVQMTVVLTSTATDYYKIGAAQSATGNTFNATADPTFTSAGTETFDVRRMRMCKGSELVPFMSTSGTESFGVSIDYDTDESLWGILGEPTATNLITNNTDISGWTNANITITGGQTAPDGTTTAFNLAETATTDLFRVYTSTTEVSSGEHVVSVFAKKGANSDWFLLRGNDTGQWAHFDLETGTIGEESGTINSASMVAIGGGWYRCSIQYTSSDASGFVMLYMTDESGTGAPSSYAGDASKYHTFWLPQSEVGTFPTSPIPTYGSTVTRDQDELAFNFANTTYGTELTLQVEWNQETVSGAGWHPIALLSEDPFNGSNTLFTGWYTSGYNGWFIARISAGNRGQLTAPLYPSSGPKRRQAVSYDTNSLHAANVNGSGTDGTVGYEMTDGSVEGLYFGNYALTWGPTVPIRYFQLVAFPRKKSLAELETWVAAIT